MTHANEYGDGVVALLELIWGQGHRAPGEPGNLARQLRETGFEAVEAENASDSGQVS